MYSEINKYALFMLFVGGRTSLSHHNNRFYFLAIWNNIFSIIRLIWSAFPLTIFRHIQDYDHTSRSKHFGI